MGRALVILAVLLGACTEDSGVQTECEVYAEAYCARWEACTGEPMCDEGHYELLLTRCDGTPTAEEYSACQLEMAHASCTATDLPPRSPVECSWAW